MAGVEWGIWALLRLSYFTTPRPVSSRFRICKPLLNCYWNVVMNRDLESGAEKTSWFVHFVVHGEGRWFESDFLWSWERKGGLGELDHPSIRGCQRDKENSDSTTSITSCSCFKICLHVNFLTIMGDQLSCQRDCIWVYSLPVCACILTLFTRKYTRSYAKKLLQDVSKCLWKLTRHRFSLAWFLFHIRLWVLVIAVIVD